MTVKIDETLTISQFLSEIDYFIVTSNSVHCRISLNETISYSKNREFQVAKFANVPDDASLATSSSVGDEDSNSQTNAIRKWLKVRINSLSVLNPSASTISAINRVHFNSSRGAPITVKWRSSTAERALILGFSPARNPLGLN